MSKVAVIRTRKPDPSQITSVFTKPCCGANTAKRIHSLQQPVRRTPKPHTKVSCSLLNVCDQFSIFSKTDKLAHKRHSIEDILPILCEIEVHLSPKKGFTTSVVDA